MNTSLKKYTAEFIGTMTLVLIGCGSVVIGGPSVGFIGVALAFGLTLTAMAYGIGPISGSHINPAVSLGIFTAGRMGSRDLIGYICAQFLGGIVGAAILSVIAHGHLTGYSVAINGLGQNGWGIGYLGQYSQGAAVLFEGIATLLFVLVILGVTQHKESPKHMAGLAIGVALVAIHLFGLNITGVSVNPARSFGPALLVGGKALAQVWLFLLIPSLAGIAAGILARLITLESPKEEPKMTGLYHRIS